MCDILRKKRKEAAVRSQCRDSIPTKKRKVRKAGKADGRDGERKNRRKTCGREHNCAIAEWDSDALNGIEQRCAERKRTMLRDRGTGNMA